MHDDDDAQKALATLGVGPAAKEMYVDLLRPAAAELGTSLLTVARLVTHAMTPLHAMVWGLDKVRDWLAVSLVKRLSKIPTEDVQSPPAHVAGPILLQLPFCAEQERLREMYANLLAAAMNKRVATTVHPAFVHVIQQVTPDEALILRSVCERRAKFGFEETGDEDGAPLVGTESISEQFRKFCEECRVDDPSSSDAYLDNLLRLKILVEQQWTQGEFQTERWNRYGHVGAFVENSTVRLVQLSAFGDRFLATCVAADLPPPAAQGDATG